MKNTMTTSKGWATVLIIVQVSAVLPTTAFVPENIVQKADSVFKML